MNTTPILCRPEAVRNVFTLSDKYVISGIMNEQRPGKKQLTIYVKDSVTADLTSLCAGLSKI